MVDEIDLDKPSLKMDEIDLDKPSLKMKGRMECTTHDNKSLVFVFIVSMRNAGYDWLGHTKSLNVRKDGRLANMSLIFVFVSMRNSVKMSVRKQGNMEVTTPDNKSPVFVFIVSMRNGG